MNTQSRISWSLLIGRAKREKQRCTWKVGVFVPAAVHARRLVALYSYAAVSRPIGGTRGQNNEPTIVQFRRTLPERYFPADANLCIRSAVWRGRMLRFEGRTGSRIWNKARSQQVRTARAGNRNRPDSGIVRLYAVGWAPWVWLRLMADVMKIDTFIQSSPHPAWLATTQGHCAYANPSPGTPLRFRFRSDQPS